MTNVDLVKHEKDVAGQNLIAVYEKYGFVQLVSRPTRVTDHSATLIDHVYTNDLLNTLSCHVLTMLKIYYSKFRLCVNYKIG